MTECAVVIRTLNEAKGLRDVLPVLLAQEPEPPRIIAVDSGSTDETLDLLRQAGAAIIRIPQSEYKGAGGRALNLGLAEVHEPFAALLSAHALPRSRYWLADLLAPMRKDESLAAVSGAINGGIPNGKGLKRDVIIGSVDEFRANPSLALVNVNTAIRMDIWRQFRFDEEIPACDDREWMVRVLEAGWRVCLTTGADVWHAHDDSSLRWLYRRGFNEYSAMTLVQPPGYLRLVFDAAAHPVVWFGRGVRRWLGYVAWRLGQVRGHAASRRSRRWKI